MNRHLVFGNLLAIFLCVSAAGEGTCTVAGTVVDRQGNPIPGATVFIEEGLNGPLSANTSDVSGRFRFTEIETGLTGVFAYANGYAFGGATLTLALGDTVEDATIVLGEPGALSGVITNDSKENLGGASIVRVLALGESPFSVPIARLRDYGVATPISDGNGQFTVPNLPTNVNLALKINHPLYAQEAIGDLRAGTPANIMLYSGVTLKGEVLTRTDRIPVSKIGVELRNAQPPHNTVITTTDGRGLFELRVKPGVYAYRAMGAGYRSPTWQNLTVRGDSDSEWVRLLVSRLGRLRGEARDAVTGNPLPDARLRLVVAGETSGVIRTGDAGTFDVEVASGVVDILVEPPPGYSAPSRAGLRVTIEENRALEIPTLWMKRIEPATVVAQRSDGSPAASAVIRVLRPDDPRWTETGSDGAANIVLKTMPAAGPVVAIAHHPTLNESALFTLKEKDETTRITLLPGGRITGSVTDDRGKSLRGAVITIFYAEEGEGEPATLWQGRADNDGQFTWPSAPAQIPLRCVAHVPTDSGEPEGDMSGESHVALTPSGGAFNVGVIVIQDGDKTSTELGKRVRPKDFDLRCGPAWLDEDPAILVNAAPVTPEIIEGLNQFAEIAQRRGVRVGIISESTTPCSENQVSFLKGGIPGIAKTYVVNREGRVVHESMALPTYGLVNLVSP